MITVAKNDEGLAAFEGGGGVGLTLAAMAAHPASAQTQETV